MPDGTIRRLEAPKRCERVVCPAGSSSGRELLSQRQVLENQVGAGSEDDAQRPDEDRENETHGGLMLPDAEILWRVAMVQVFGEYGYTLAAIP